jgi:hypothetical protein
MKIRFSLFKNNTDNSPQSINVYLFSKYLFGVILFIAMKDLLSLWLFPSLGARDIVVRVNIISWFYVVFYIVSKMLKKHIHSGQSPQ